MPQTPILLPAVAGLLLGAFLLGCSSAPPRSEPDGMAVGAPAPESTTAATEATADARPSGSPPPGGSEPALESPPPGVTLASPSYRNFIESRLSRLLWIVSAEGSPSVGQRVAKAAVAQANRWLAANGALVGEAPETAKSLTLGSSPAGPTATAGPSTLVARELGADLRLDLVFSTKEGGKAGRYSASVQGSMILAEGGTGEVLAEFPFTSQTFYSPSSMETAAIGAIGSTVWTLMPGLAGRARELLAVAWNGGLRYELLARGLADPKMTLAFARTLGSRVRTLSPLPSFSGESRFEAVALLSSAEMEAAILAAAKAAGLPPAVLRSRGGRFFNLEPSP